jgi:LacI family transcriptional regulator
MISASPSITYEPAAEGTRTASPRPRAVSQCSPSAWAFPSTTRRAQKPVSISVGAGRRLTFYPPMSERKQTDLLSPRHANRGSVEVSTGISPLIGQIVRGNGRPEVLTSGGLPPHPVPSVNRFASPQRVTIADVALLAEVSKTTVSHVLSGKRPVAQSTRKRVEEAIEELGYRPDGLARSLRSRRSHMVALMIPDITNPYYPLLARGLEEGIGGGYRTFICNTDGAADREKEFLEEVTDRMVDGIVIDSFMMSPDKIRAVVGGRTPIILIGTTVMDAPGFDAVHSDDEHGAFDATMHLFRLGHRRVGMIQGPPGAGGGRNEGYLRALDEASAPLDPDLVASDEWTRPGGTGAARRLLQRPNRPTGIFCANDLMALGAMDAASELGLDVPGDIAIVGFDDIEAAGMVTPGLTTVSNPAYETGRLAGIMLRERMTGRYSGTPRTVTLPSRLIVRAST